MEWDSWTEMKVQRIWVNHLDQGPDLQSEYSNVVNPNNCFPELTGTCVLSVWGMQLWWRSTETVRWRITSLLNRKALPTGEWDAGRRAGWFEQEWTDIMWGNRNQSYRVSRRRTSRVLWEEKFITTVVLFIFQSSQTCCLGRAGPPPEMLSKLYCLFSLNRKEVEGV